MRRFAFSILICLSTAVPAPSQAAVVDGLYEAEVQVADQGAASRNEALQRALSAVLVKATGRRDLAGIGGVAELLADAQRHLQQFRYTQRQVLDPVSGELRPVLYLWARFDAAAVQRALLERNVAIWGRERPATLVWLAYEDGRERGVVSDESPELFRHALHETAARRGVPVIDPLMDIEDRINLPFSEIWGGFDQSIRAASERYGPNAVLTGRLYRYGAESWSARWILIEDATVLHRESPPGPLAVVVADGVHWTADLFAERYALRPDPAADGQVRVQVDGIGGFVDYARIGTELRTLSMVNAVRIESTHSDSIVFLVDLRGTPSQLESAIGLGGRLVPHPEGHDAEWGAMILRYRIRP